jgi:hypothetical protein
MFVIVNLQITFQAKFVGMFKVCLHAIFHMPDSNGFLVTAVKLKDTENVCMTDMLYIPQKYYHNSYTIFTDTHKSPMSMSTMLLILIVGNQEV